MTGGKTTQTSSYSSGVNYAPVVSGHGRVNSGNITTGASGGNLSGSSTGAGITAGVSLPGMGGKKLMLMNLCTVLDGVTNNSLLAVRGSDACSYTSNVTNGGTMTIGGLILL